MGVYTGTKVNRTSEVFTADPANERCIARQENLVPYSEDFSQWSLPSFITITTNNITAPDGKATADLVSTTTNESGPYVSLNPVPQNTTYTLSVFLKYGNTPTIRLRDFDGGDNPGHHVIFNLLTQTFSSALNLDDYGYILYPNGWYRVWMTFTTGSYSNISFQVRSASEVSGDETFYAWGGQIEKNSIMSEYLPTSGTAVSRTTTISDLSTSAVAGTKKGKVAYDPYTRRGVFDFNNTTSDFIEFSRDARIDITDNLTIETWVYVKSYVNGGGILTYGTTSGEQFSLKTTTTNVSTIAFTTNWPNTVYSAYSAPLRTNRWYHIVATFSSGSWAIYVNGTLSNSGSFAISTLPQVSNAYVTLGNNHPAASEYFDGLIGATKIYGRVLPEVEIIDNYQASRTRYGFRYDASVLELPANAIGLTQGNPASSAAAIKAAYPYAPDGVYWIDLPTSGATRTYCLMDDVYDGGGWMLMLKATRGTTFQYSANYWTTDNTLNSTLTSEDDGDAKFDVMNKFEAKDMMAIWPDIQLNGGSIIGGDRGWTWLQNDFYGGTRITPISFWNTVDRYFLGDAKLFSGWASGIFSSQTSVRFYGFNYRNDQTIDRPGPRVRWGFGWNENNNPPLLFPNANMASDDVTGGIGLNGNQQRTTAEYKYSAGDIIGCCQDTSGINRSARVLLFVR